VNAEIPPWLAGIIDRLLSKPPSERFHSAAEVADLLEKCLAHVQQPMAVPLPDMPGLARLAGRNDRRLRYLTAGASTLVVLSAIAWLVRLPPIGQPTTSEDKFGEVSTAPVNDATSLRTATEASTRSQATLPLTELEWVDESAGDLLQIESRLRWLESWEQ
jgi:hypothetical protein